MACGRNDIPCPLTTYQVPIGGGVGIPVTAVFEILGAALLFYQLLQQYELWEKDLENLQELAECYEEIGTCYKEARLALRGRDQEIYDYQNSRPSYPGPCENRIQQARINGLLEVQATHERAMKTLPSWACGDKTNIDIEAAKSEIKIGMHNIATSRNYEHNQEDRYEQMRITALARSAGGAIPNLSGAFQTVAAIGQDSLARSTASFNSALGAFGNVAGSIANKYFSGDGSSRTNNTQQVQNNVVNNNVVNNNSTFREETIFRDDDAFRIRNSEINAFNDPPD